MSKKKKNEQPVELNDAALEATSGGTIFENVHYDNDNWRGDWAYISTDGEMVRGVSFDEAIKNGETPATRDQIIDMTNMGYAIWKH